MQRVHSSLFFRRVLFTIATKTRVFHNIHLQDVHSYLSSNGGVMHLSSKKYTTQSDQSIMQRLKNFIGLGPLSKGMSRITGYKLYESLDHVDHEIFFKKLNLDDTFHSWFTVRGLHVWMLMVRLMNEGDNGRLVRNAVVAAMWDDVEAKSKQLGETSSGVRRKQIQSLVDEFQASIFSYDEGLMSSDTVLAGAIWRNLLSQRDFDPRHLEVLVDYVRENIATLDKISFEELHTSKVQWTKICF